MSSSRRIVQCQHRQTISTIHAGLERIVCEKCGHVSVKYIESTLLVERDMDDSSSEPGAGCGWCLAPVEFLIPGGKACGIHAWREASRQLTLGSEPWIPIEIDQPTTTR